MYIILDTNIIRKDFMLRTADFTNLLDYLVKTKSKILIPQVVFEEIKNLYKNELINRQKSYTSSLKQLNSLLIENFECIYELNIEEVTTQYMEYLKLTLNIGEEDIVPYKDYYLHEVFKRAIKRIKPCSPKGEEFRDTLLWLTILDIAKDNSNEKISFISSNKKDFAHESDGNQLHPDLIKDIEEIGIEVQYYSSLSQFIQNHTTKIRFIDEPWIREHIDINEVNHKFLDILTNYEQDSLLERAKDEFTQCTGYLNPCTGSLDIDEFFVYEKIDGSLYLEVNLSGEIEVEVEYEDTVETEKERQEYDYVLNPFTGDMELKIVNKPRFTTETEFKFAYIYPEYEVKLAIGIKDKKIEKYTIKEFNCL